MLRRVWNGQIARSYDRWSHSYDSQILPKFQRRGYSYPILCRDIFSFLSSEQFSGAWLELGVGTGLLGAEMRKVVGQRVRLAGLDISTMMLRSAAGTGAYDDLVCAAADRIPFADNSFPVVVSSFMFHNVLDQRSTLQEIYRVLTCNGVFILVDLLRSRKRVPFLSRLADNVLSMQHEHGAPSHYRSMTEVIILIRQARLRVLEVRQLDRTAFVERSSAGRRMHGLVLARKYASV